MNARSAGSQAQPIRSMNMNNYPSQQNSRQSSRLQNSQKTGLGNGNAGAGWAFGAPSAGAFGGLGAAPGLGGRPGQLSGFAQVMGGGGGQGPIDMSDFPSLSGGPRPQPTNVNWSSNTVRQPPMQQQPMAPQQQRAPSTAPSQQSIDQYDGQRSQPSNERGGGDDYPALGGQLNGNLNSHPQSNGIGSSVGSPDESHPQPNGQQTQQLPIRAASYSSNQQAPIGSNLQPTPAETQPPMSQVDNVQSAPQAQTVKKWGDMTEQEKYGMAGLGAQLEARRCMDAGLPVDDTMPPQIKNGITTMMGLDLDELGMDLQDPEPIYKSFHAFPDQSNSYSTYDRSRRNPVPDFKLPEAYNVSNVPPLPGRLPAMSDETLFQLFFTRPRDVIQELAAIELNNRDWRWHKTLRQWLQKDNAGQPQPSNPPPVVDLTNGAPAAAPTRISERVERGIYIFWDPPNWRRERREFTLDYDCLHDPRAPAAVNGFAGAAPLGAPA